MEKVILLLLLLDHVLTDGVHELIAFLYYLEEVEVEGASPVSQLFCLSIVECIILMQPFVEVAL